ncbi:hypothetical protein PG999_011321 [Apiospora kogelbergensis]|uniref:Uncharacterized protein n=1 Tax=Apiospora kogelbergensis TaxID=1337665 RepID=A0AAW0QK85_9PEZI
MAENDPGVESEPDFDYHEDAMFAEYLPLPVIDQEAVEEQVDAAREAAVERLVQFERDQRLRRRLQRNALVNRFRRMRSSANFQYQVRMSETFREVRDYFAQRHHFRWLKTMRGVRPNRSAGGANLFAELDVEGGGGAANDAVEKRRIVVKHGEDPARLWDEISCLALLGELEHVVNVVSLGDEDERAESAGLGQVVEEEDDDLGISEDNWEVLENTEAEDSPGSAENEDIPPVPMEVEDSPRPPGALPSRPTLILEYMEMGDLNEFRKRMKAAGVNPPQPASLADSIMP